MKILKIILLLVLVNLFVGCDDENSNDFYSKNISSVYIECDYLDTIFSDLLYKDNINGKKFYIKNYIINSKEELDAINSFDFDVDCIDFSKYTLFGSILFNNNHIQSFGINLNLLVNSTEISVDSTYFFQITICEREDDYEPIKSVYKWVLYPKFAEGIKTMVSFEKTKRCGI